MRLAWGKPRNDKANRERMALNSGALARNRTTDTRIFNVGCLRSRRFSDVPKSLILQRVRPAPRLVPFPRQPAFCVVFFAGLHGNYTSA